MHLGSFPRRVKRFDTTIGVTREDQLISSARDLARACFHDMPCLPNVLSFAFPRLLTKSCTCACGISFWVGKPHVCLTKRYSNPAKTVMALHVPDSVWIGCLTE